MESQTVSHFGCHGSLKCLYEGCPFPRLCHECTLRHDKGHTFSFTEYNQSKDQQRKSTNLDASIPNHSGMYKKISLNKNNILKTNQKTHLMSMSRKTLRLLHVLSEDHQIPLQNDQIPSEDDQIPQEDYQILSEDDQIPLEDDQIPSEDDQSLSEDDQIPSDDDQIPSHDEQSLPSVSLNPIEHSQHKDHLKPSMEIELNKNGNIKNGFECTICSTVFNTPGRLAVHLYNSHQVDSTGDFLINPEGNEFNATIVRVGKQFHWKCVLCSLIQRTQLMRKHFRAHSDHRPYQCGLCEKAFKTNYAMKLHQSVHGKRQVHLKYYHCTACPYSTLDSRHFKNHMKAHANGSNKRPKPTKQKPFVQPKSNQILHKELKGEDKIRATKELNRFYKFKDNYEGNIDVIPEETTFFRKVTKPSRIIHLQQDMSQIAKPSKVFAIPYKNSSKWQLFRTNSSSFLDPLTIRFNESLSPLPGTNICKSLRENIAYQGMQLDYERIRCILWCDLNCSEHMKRYGVYAFTTGNIRYHKNSEMHDETLQIFLNLFSQRGLQRSQNQVTALV